MCLCVCMYVYVYIYMYTHCGIFFFGQVYAGWPWTWQEIRPGLSEILFAIYKLKQKKTKEVKS